MARDEQELNDRLFTLKKRLRDDDMKEILEYRNKSIIEVYERNNKNKKALKDNKSSNK
jgi:hypothetical protein